MNTIAITYERLKQNLRNSLTINSHDIKLAIEEYLLQYYGEKAVVDDNNEEEQEYPHAYDIALMSQSIANKLNGISKEKH